MEPKFKGQHEEPAPLPMIINEEEEYEVEKVRKHRKHRRGTQYLVHLKSYVLWQPLDTKSNDHTTSKSLKRISSGDFTRELDKEPSLHCSSIYITYKWSMLQQYYSCPNVHASSSCPLLIHHTSTLRLPCFLHVP